MTPQLDTTWTTSCPILSRLNYRLPRFLWRLLSRSLGKPVPLRERVWVEPVTPCLSRFLWSLLSRFPYLPRLLRLPRVVRERHLVRRATTAL
jgi:hypothetical protein